MHRFLSGAALSAILVAGNVAPAFANMNTVSEVPANEVALDPNLVEIEGRILTDAEAAEVEGEIVWKPILVGAAIGAGVNLARRTHACYTLPGAKCGWQQYAGAAATGAATGAAVPAAKGAAAVTLARQARLTWFMRR